METYTVEGWLGGEHVADEHGVEKSALDNMICELEEEGFTVLVFRE